MTIPKAIRGRPPKYPWDEWTNGEVHSLTQGKDFNTNMASFRALVHYTAKTRELTAETSEASGNRIWIQFKKNDS